MALRSANHTVIRVVNTTQCHMIHQLVWYAHFIFTVYNRLAIGIKIIAECLSMRHTIVRGRRQWAYSRDPHIFIYVRIYGKMQKYTISC